MICCGSQSSLSVKRHRRAPTMASTLRHRFKAQCFSSTIGQQHTAQLQHGQELDDSFTGLDAGTGLMTVAGFGSLLSEHSARTTFPDLQNFRPGKLFGYRRVFAHTADIFFKRGIARPETREISSLSCEPLVSNSGGGSNRSSSTAGNQPQQSSSGSNSSSRGDSSSNPPLVVSLFEVPYNPDNVAAFIAREHEFRFLAVQAYDLSGQEPTQRLAVLCGANTDEHYKATRCPPEEWKQRWGVHGIDTVWSNDVLPCRVYLRHCVLAAKGFCNEAYESFLDCTYLADRVTTIRQYLQDNPDIMDELPPPELVGRYSG